MTRLKSIDVLRGVAIIMMGQYHFMRWFINESLLSSWLHSIIYVPGKLSAPFFLLISGVGAMMMYESYHVKKKDDFQIFIENLKRGLFLIFLTIPLNILAVFFFNKGAIWEWNIFQLVGIAMLGTVLWGRYGVASIAVSFLLVFVSWKFIPGKYFFNTGVAPILPWLSYYLLGCFLGKIIISALKSKKYLSLALSGALLGWGIFIILMFKFDWFLFHVGHKQRLEMVSMALIFFMFSGVLFSIELLLKFNSNILNWFATLGMIPLSVYYIHLVYKYAIVSGLKFLKISCHDWGMIQWFILNLVFWSVVLIFINRYWDRWKYQYSVEYFMSQYVSKRSNFK